MYKKVSVLILFIVLLFSSVTSYAIDNSVKVPLRISYIDVGQADSILIQTPSGKNMLIDAGNNEDADNIMSYLKKQNVKKLDAVVGTHPHEDHIGAMDSIIKTFNIGKVYMPKVTTTTKTFEDVILAIKAKKLKIDTANAGVKIDIDSKVSIQILAPNSEKYDDLNNYSAVIKLVYGNTSFLFTGDAEDISEKEMLSKKYELKADVLKVGHHGSNSSTSVSFLNVVKPKYAVISVGKKNEYGLPTKLTMEKLKTWRIPVYRTDECGTVVATSDGKDIKFSGKAGSYSYSGDDTNASTNDSKETQQPTLTPQPTPTLVPIMTPTPQESTSKIVYYTPKGGSYHYSIGCPTLARSKNILSGTIEEAIKSGHGDPCDKCVK